MRGDGGFQPIGTDFNRLRVPSEKLVEELWDVMHLDVVVSIDARMVAACEDYEDGARTKDMPNGETR